MAKDDIPARDRFTGLLRVAVAAGTFVKLTLGKYRGTDTTLRNLLARPVTLKAGPHVALTWRHKTRDIARNLPPNGALELLEPLIGGDFLDAHLFTRSQKIQLECQPDGTSRMSAKAESGKNSVSATSSHDREKERLIAPTAPWLRALGVTNDQGQPRQGQTAKFSQINNFADLLSHLMDEAFPERTSVPPCKGEAGVVGGRSRQGDRTPGPLAVTDMGSGKGYLTFAIADLLGESARVQGIEERPELVALCNEAAADHGFDGRLKFVAGTISATTLDATDILVALHACDTATDDAIAKGVAAGARLIVVAPCCHKELRSQLAAPDVLAGALRHGIFQERQSEFVTDALRAQLLEWAGYRTKVFEFISTEHTAKNLMIAAVKSQPPGDPAAATRVREFARFYGIHRQRLADHLGLALAVSS